ncbi:Ig-like domain-containing protein, partial [Pantoea endophytica]|uniref:Ig-like domain-containing protein n=1 Tax=Pantoea endophytica TaxID=92488 RepID=UPI00301B1D9B
AGNTSEAVSLKPIEVDTSVPGAVTDVVLKDDSGAIVGGITNDSTPTVSGKGEPGATVTLKDDKGTALGSTTVDKDGNWSITP